MKLDVETFESASGWTSDGSITASVNNFPEYIADNKAASLVFSVPSGSIGKSVTKTLGIALGGYPEIVLSVWSQKLASTSGTFYYQIEFATGKAFYLQVLPGFTQVSFWVEGLATVDYIKITALSNNADALLCSACVAVLDEYPRDVMAGVQTEIQKHLTNVTGSGKLLGTVTASAGADHISVSEFSFIDRMAVVKIDDGTHSEIHALDRTDEGKYYFASVYDGPALLHSYSSANVYLYFPVEFGRYDEDAVIPGIFIWKMAPDPVMRSSDVDEVYDSPTATGFQSRRIPINLSYNLMIDCEARHNEILALLSRVVRRWLGSNLVWINGRSHTFQWSIPPEEIDSDQSVEQFPKVQYTVDIEVQEEREDRASTVKVSTKTISVTPVQELP